MLKLIIPEQEFYNESTQEFYKTSSITIELEHSLVSLSKWESKFEKPFLSSKDKTPEEVFWYIESMILTPNVSPDILLYLSNENLLEINEYLDSKQSATTFNEIQSRQTSGEVVTSELIYFWMITLNIPFTCDTWHLNRLLSLIRICSIKNTKGKKMSRNEVAQRNRDLNAQRRAMLNTSG